MKAATQAARIEGSHTGPKGLRHGIYVPDNESRFDGGLATS